MEIKKFMKKVFTMGVVLTTILWTMGAVAFVPVASAVEIAAGDLIKIDGNSAVYYYAADGQRYVFSTFSTYESWYSDFAGIKTIDADELTAIDIGGNVVVRAGSKFITVETSAKVYAVEPNGMITWITDEASVKALYGDSWGSRVVTLPDGFFTNYTNTGLELDGTAYPAGQIVSLADVNYYVNADGSWSVVSAAGFTGNNWNAAFTAPALLAIPSAGTEIATAMDTYSDVSQGGGAGALVTPVTGSTLTVALAGDTPASHPVADAANDNFTKLSFTSTGGASEISKIIVNKGGYSSISDIENIKLTTLGGVNVGNTASLNSNGTASLTFNPALAIAANETVSYFIRAGFVSGKTGGITASFSIAAATDVTSTAGAVAGSFPVQGNAMTLVDVPIGSAEVTAAESIVDTTPDVGDENVVVNSFRVTAGTTEAITVESITLLEAGTASLTDISNIELWSVTENKSLGEVAAWSASGKASFGGLNLVVGKGDIYRFKVRVDIVSGSGLTTNADLTDGDSDVLMTVKGNSYGFYITPTATASWKGTGGATTAVNQTINSGALVITKSTLTPATGNIAEAPDQTLVVWDFEAKGEPIKITEFNPEFTTLGTDADGADLINCKLYDENMALVAGPIDGTNTAFSDDGTGGDGVRFTDTFIVPVGTHAYTFKCRVFDSEPDDWANGATFAVGIDPDTNITAKGFNTKDTITPSPTTDVNGNTQTLAVATLTGVTLGSPAAQSVAVNTQDFIWSVFSLDASNSGEAVNVTSVIMEDTYTDTDVSVTGGFADIDNAEIWCDVASGSSERGDDYEKKVSDTEQPAGDLGVEAVHTFSFVETLIVPKNSYVRCALVGDLGATAEDTDIHAISLDVVSGGVVASGATTGMTVTFTPSGAGQNMTVATSGDVTLTVDASSPKASIFVGGETGVTLGVFKLKTNTVEAVDLDSMILTDEGADDAVATYYFYSSKRADGIAITEPIASQVGGATATVIISDDTVHIAADSYVLVTVKGDIQLVDGTTIVNGDAITATFNADSDIDTTGLSSGIAIDPNDTNIDAAAHVVYKARPVVTVDSSSPSGTIGTGASTLVAVFRVDNADGLDDVTFSAAGDDDIVFNMSGYNSGATCASCAVVFKDKAGNLLSDSQTAEDLSGAIAVTDLNLDFTDATLTVPAGGYELIRVYADTTDFTTAGNSLQVWLDDAADANFSWGIGGAVTVYETAVISFRGDIYGNTLGK